MALGSSQSSLALHIRRAKVSNAHNSYSSLLLTITDHDSLLIQVYGAISRGFGRRSSHTPVTVSEKSQDRSRERQQQRPATGRKQTSGTLPACERLLVGYDCGSVRGKFLAQTGNGRRFAAPWSHFSRGRNCRIVASPQRLHFSEGIIIPVS